MLSSVQNLSSLPKIYSSHYKMHKYLFILYGSIQVALFTLNLRSYRIKLVTFYYKYSWILFSSVIILTKIFATESYFMFIFQWKHFLPGVQRFLLVLKPMAGQVPVSSFSKFPLQTIRSRERLQERPCDEWGKSKPLLGKIPLSRFTSMYVK